MKWHISVITLHYSKTILHYHTIKFFNNCITGRKRKPISFSCVAPKQPPEFHLFRRNLETTLIEHMCRLLCSKRQDCEWEVKIPSIYRPSRDRDLLWYVTFVIFSLENALQTMLEISLQVTGSKTRTLAIQPIKSGRNLLVQRLIFKINNLCYISQTL